jgi:hypothetical protein
MQGATIGTLAVGSAVGLASAVLFRAELPGHGQAMEVASQRGECLLDPPDRSVDEPMLPAPKGQLPAPGNDVACPTPPMLSRRVATVSELGGAALVASVAGYARHRVISGFAAVSADEASIDRALEHSRSYRVWGRIEGGALMAGVALLAGTAAVYGTGALLGAGKQAAANTGAARSEP